MIGIFDSGVGGLAIFREVDKLLPRADLLYLADTAAFPYGPRPPRYLKKRTAAITRFLIGRGAGLVVVACNTATVVAIAHLRETFRIPFAGVVPPVKVAAGRAAEQEPIFVLLTRNTASGRKYTELVESFGCGRKVQAVSLPLLAQVVEEGTFREAAIASEVRRTVNEALGELTGGAKLVLGCTHYVFLKELLQAAVGEAAEILEPSRAVAEQVVRLLAENGIQSQESGKRHFYSTGEPVCFSRQVASLLKCAPPEVEKIELGEP